MSFELPDPRRDEDIPDIDALKAEISVSIDEALEIADALAVLLAAGESPSEPHIFQLARDYMEKRRHVRRVRAVLKVQAAG